MKMFGPKYFSADLTWAYTPQKATLVFCQVQEDMQNSHILSPSFRRIMNVATTELVVDHVAVGIVAGVCRNVWDCQTKLSDVASDTGRCNSLQGFFGILSVMFYGVIYHIWWSIWSKQWSILLIWWSFITQYLVCVTKLSDIASETNRQAFNLTVTLIGQNWLVLHTGENSGRCPAKLIGLPQMLRWSELFKIASYITLDVLSLSNIYCTCLERQ